MGGGRWRSEGVGVGGLGGGEERARGEVGGLRFGVVRSQILRFGSILGESIVETAMITRNPLLFFRSRCFCFAGRLWRMSLGFRV